MDETKLAGGFNLFSLIDAKDLPEFNKQTERIQAFGEEINDYPSYTPKKDDLCLVKDAGKWRRAVFVECFTSSNNNNNDDNGDARVLLIDLCKAIDIHSKFIRNIPTELAHMPILTFVATIKGFNQNIDKANAANFIFKFKPMATMTVTSICENAEKGIYTIDI